ncbi:MAG TPA: ABATE domain-containing protein [Bryobacteraceae bacterium]|jgi:predicted RNA-binding Zn ribbon-like protein
MLKDESDSDWRDGFLFVGNHPALDFLNTRPLLRGEEPAELLPDIAAVLRWFRAANMLGAREVSELRRRWRESESAGRALDSLHQLREKLRKEILKYEVGGDVGKAFVEEINKLMARHPMQTRLIVTGEGFRTEAYCEPREPDDLLGPVAHSIAALLADLDRAKIRKCRHCVLHFYDTSRKGTRRWCSMQICGNRAKVATYAARRRR